MIKFFILSSGQSVPAGSHDSVFLRIDHWNDYSFVTIFRMLIADNSGNVQDIGNIKIGFRGQTIDLATYQKLDKVFPELGSNFFSLGQGVEFYKKMASLPEGGGRHILELLNDIVAKPEIIEGLKGEQVFSVSFLRNVSVSVIKGQYARVFEGKSELTDFNFKFKRISEGEKGEGELKFEVTVGSKPSTNIHAVIGRNGVGKTTLLNEMITSITNREESKAKFYIENLWEDQEIPEYYFSSLVSVSFSAFDPFSPPDEQPDPSKGTCYFYIGLKKIGSDEGHKNNEDLRRSCAEALVDCFQSYQKKELWCNAIKKLGSDENFYSMSLDQLVSKFDKCKDRFGGQSDSNALLDQYYKDIKKFLKRMSSGHAIVLLTLTRLVATVEEKTLVLLDEPESHLHPPLLSAFVRALSDLLLEKNGVAIIATHSPVILQEIPKSCVWKVYRTGSTLTVDRPKIETFAENVGVLTSEVFSLEVERSGFHDLLAQQVSNGDSYEQILELFDNQIGFEGRAILKSLVADRDRKDTHSL